MKNLYKVTQKTLRKVIDSLMTIWLWAYKKEKEGQERHDHK